MAALFPGYVVIIALFVFAICGQRNSSRFSEGFLANDSTVNVTIDSHHSIHTLSDKFVSVTLDSWELEYNLRFFHIGSTRFQNLAKALAPAYLRVGGTAADSLSFKSAAPSEHVVDEHEIDNLFHFTKTVGWDVIFDLNLLLRKNGKWNSTNAESLLRYAASKGYVMDLELGNEPNLYERRNIHIDPAQIGHDYGTLRHLMNTIPPFNNRMLLGPALTGYFPPDYAEKFLSTGSTYINAMTVHHYYMDGALANQSDFLNPRVLNTYQDILNRAQSALSKASKGTHTYWILETSSTYGGGTRGLSESFISGFFWLDKLGVSAVNGVPVVARQDFVGGNYGLVSDDNDQPLPDYWLTLLYKRLVGKKVLNVTSSEHNNRFRMYAHCSADRSHPKGVTFYFQNMYDSEVKLNVQQYIHHYYQLYTLTAGGNGTLISNKVLLNGHELRMNGDSLPNLEPITATTWPVIVPKHSFGFLVSPDADAAACP